MEPRQLFPRLSVALNPDECTTVSYLDLYKAWQKKTRAVLHVPAQQSIHRRSQSVRLRTFKVCIWFCTLLLPGRSGERSLQTVLSRSE